MCKAGDIILVFNYAKEGLNIGQHSFVVINDKAGQIQGLPYDIICNVMSSFKSEEQRKHKLGYPGNFEVLHTDTEVKDGNAKDGFIKAEQFYYFNKSKLKFKVIGTMNEESFKELIDFIMGLSEIQQIIDNL